MKTNPLPHRTKWLDALNCLSKELNCDRSFLVENIFEDFFIKSKPKFSDAVKRIIQSNEKQIASNEARELTRDVNLLQNLTKSIVATANFDLYFNKTLQMNKYRAMIDAYSKIAKGMKPNCRICIEDDHKKMITLKNRDVLMDWLNEHKGFRNIKKVTEVKQLKNDNDDLNLINYNRKYKK